MKNLTIFSIFLLSFFSISSFGQGVQLTKDFVPGDDGGMYDGQIITSFGGSVIIEFYVEGEQNSLFVSDGTESGTTEVYKLGGNGYVRDYFNVDRSIYIIVNVGSDKYSLIKLEDKSSSPDLLLTDWKNINTVTYFNNNLYFQGEKDDSSSDSLYHYDPISKTITSSIPIHWLHSIKDITVHNNNLYFISGKSSDALALYKYDGVSAEADLIYDFKTFDNYYTNINMISSGDFLYFWYINPQKEYCLFSSDGTTNGTKILNNTFTHINFKPISYNDKVYFGAKTEGESGSSLYVSNGTVESTKKIELVDPSTTTFGPNNLQIFNNSLYMSSSYNLLKLNQNSSKVEKVFDDNTFGGGYLVYGADMAIFNDSLAFVLENKDYYTKELWISDGTDSGTKKINHDLAGSNIRYISQLTTAENKLFFSANHDSYGLELFVYSPDNLSKSNEVNLKNKNTSVFPNPVKNSISFDIDEQIISVKIFDIAGNKVFDKNNNIDSQLDINFLNSGIYLIKIKTLKNQYTGKFNKID